MRLFISLSLVFLFFQSSISFAKDSQECSSMFENNDGSKDEENKKREYYNALLEHYQKNESASDKMRINLLSMHIFYEIVVSIKDPNATLYPTVSEDKTVFHPINKKRLEEINEIYKTFKGVDLVDDPFISETAHSTYDDENLPFGNYFSNIVKIYYVISELSEEPTEEKIESGYGLPIITRMEDVPTYQEIFENIDKYRKVVRIAVDSTYDKILDRLLKYGIDASDQYINQVRVRDWMNIFKILWGKRMDNSFEFFAHYPKDITITKSMREFTFEPQYLKTAIEVYYINLLLQQNVQIKSKVQKTVSQNIYRPVIDLYDDGTILVYDTRHDSPGTRIKPISPVIFFTGFRTELHDIVDVVCSNDECLFLRKDGKIILWEYRKINNDNLPKVVDGYDNVVAIAANACAFAGIQEIQGVRSGFTFGHEIYGGDYSKVADKISKNVLDVVANHYAFAFRVKNESQTLGVTVEDYRGVPSTIAAELPYTSFALPIKYESDTTVVTLGRDKFGGDSSAVTDKLHGIVKVEPKGTAAFTATRIDGKEISWGKEW